VCGGSPLILYLECFSFRFDFDIHVGENTQGRVLIFNSRSPLSEPEFLLVVFFVLQLTGRFTGRGDVITLVLPSLNCNTIIQYKTSPIHVREITQGRFVIFVLPL